MKPHSEAVRAGKYTLVAIVTGTLIALGIGWNSNYREYNNRTIKQGDETRITKTYSPLSYLELISEKGVPKRISKKSALTDKEILGFKLNHQGRVEEIIQNDYFIWKPKLRSSPPWKNKEKKLQFANQTAQRYITYFKKK